MNFLLLLTILSAICSILGFFSSKWFKSQKWFYAALFFVLTFLSGYIVNMNSELERIKNIHRKAEALASCYDSYTPSTPYIQEALVFLEENKSLYPDSYERARQIYSKLENEEIPFERGAADKIYGIIKGIALLNKK